MQTLITRGMAGMALAMLLYGPASYADGPPEAYENGGQSVRSIKPNDYLVNADGAKEDPDARMSDRARAFRNGWIQRGSTDDRILKRLIQQQHDQEIAAARAVDQSGSEPMPAAPPQAAVRYAPPPPSYAEAPQPQQYAPPVYAPPVYAPPPPPPVQPVQYVPVYPPPPVYQQPVYAPPPVFPVVVAAGYPVARAGYYGARGWYGGGFRRWR